MNLETIQVKQNQFLSHCPKRIPKGTVKAESVQIQLDREWDGLTVIVHWLNVANGVEISSVLERDKPNSIPWEVLTDLGELRMGLVGMDGDTTVKPTRWLTYGRVVEGVDPDGGIDPQEPTETYLTQMVEQANQANQAAQDAKDYAQQVAENIENAGPYAEEAQKAAQAAKVSENAAKGAADNATQQATKAQAAVASIGNAVEEAQRAATNAGAAKSAAETAQTAASQYAGSAQTNAATASQAAQMAQNAATQAGQYLATVEADAQAAADSALAAGQSQKTAQGAAQEAGNARDQANSAATTAQSHAIAASTAKTEAEQAAGNAATAKTEAEQAAQAATGAASASQAAQQAAEAASAVFPPLTEDVSNKFLAADSEGKKLNFVDAPIGVGDGYEWRLIRTVAFPEDPTTDQSGVTWMVNDSGQIFGFSFDTDKDGLPFEAEEIIFGASGDFYPVSGTRQKLNIQYKSSGSSISYYRGWPQGAVRRLTFNQNKISDLLCDPLFIEQFQYASPPAILIPLYNGASSTVPFKLNDKYWTVFGFAANVDTSYMESFRFDIYGRFKK